MKRFQTNIFYISLTHQHQHNLYTRKINNGQGGTCMLNLTKQNYQINL